MIAALLSCSLLALLLYQLLSLSSTSTVDSHSCRSQLDVTISAEALQAYDDRQGAEIQKIDERGRFLLFEGVTIVMPIIFTAATTSAHVAVYKLLSQPYSSNMSVLPMRSYHVTLSSIISRPQTDTLEQYNSRVLASHDRLVAVKRLLQQEAADVTFRAADVRACHIGISPTLLPASESDRAQLQRWETLVADALGPLYEKQDRNHMSLAYDIPPLTMDDNSCRALEKAVMGLYDGMDFIVGPPQLCVFSDMTHFQPV